MSPALTALAADPPPPANAMPLAAVEAERAVQPAIGGFVSAWQRELELPAPICLSVPAPARGAAEEAWKRIPATAPVERITASRAAIGALLAQRPDPELPVLSIALCSAALAESPAGQAWTRIPAAAPVERLVAPRVAAVVAFSSSSALPATMGCLALADPVSSIMADARHSLPQPRTVVSAPIAAGPVRNVVIMAPAAHQPERYGYFPSGPQREAPALPEAVGARSLATPVSGRAPASPPLRLPSIGDGPVPNRGLVSASFVNPAAPPAEENAMPRQIVQVPVSTVSIRHPKSPEPIKFAALPLAELQPLEYFCSRGPRTHPHGVGWIIPSLSATAPRFTSPLMIERLEPLPAVTVMRKRPAFADIFSLPEAASLRSTKLRDWGKIAAILVVGAALWLGAGYVRANHDAGAGLSLSAKDSLALPANPDTERASGGIFHRVRSAISWRAEVHLNDGFHDGMAAWGAPSKSWAPGWVHHPEGFVTPGKLALYQPTLRYADYRFEFFGQIDAKSLDWAVRAKDDANYYAMKFAADGPGPRAVVSMIHYSVVGGQKGPSVVTPVTAMIHEHTPYHVEVDVQGDRITTSIEGEQVDSFVDDTLARGGVGFFADAGEQARLYWIKVSRNEDWLGRVCAFLSGGGSSTAQLWPPDGTMPRPDSRDPIPNKQLVLAAGFGFIRRNPFGRISDHRRHAPWRS
jgi:hypothetical protein